MPIIVYKTSSVHGLDGNLAALSTADADEVSARIAGDEAAIAAGDTALQAHITGAFATAQSLLDTINSDANTTGSFRKEVKDLIDGAPVGLSTLKKIADYIAVNPEANIAAAITAQVEAAIASIVGTADALMDTLGEAETALNAETAARIAAIADLDASLRAYADQSGGGKLTTFVTEALVLAGGIVTASHAPQNGVIWNATITDGAGLAVAGVIAPTITGAQINIGSTNYDGMTLTITYGYGGAEVDIVALIDAEFDVLLPPATVIGGTTTPISLVNGFYNPASVTIDSNGLSVSSAAGNDYWATISIGQGLSSGKYYYEVAVDQIQGALMEIGFSVAPDAAKNDWLGSNEQSIYDAGIGAGPDAFYIYPGNPATATSVASPAYAMGDVVGIALDMDVGTAQFYLNGVSPGVGITGITGTVYPAVSLPSIAQGGGAVTFNFGATAYAHTAPSGFANLVAVVGGLLPANQVLLGNRTWGPVPSGAVTKALSQLLPVAPVVGGEASVGSFAGYSGGDIIVSNGGLTLTGNTTGWWRTAEVAQGVSSGKHYFEVALNNIESGSGPHLGFAAVADHAPTIYLGDTVHSGSPYDTGFAITTGQGATYIGLLSSVTANPAFYPTLVDGDVLGVALDMDAGTVEYFINGVSTGGVYFEHITGTVYPAVSLYAPTESVTFNFGGTAFTGTVPDGFASGFTGFTGGIGPKKQVRLADNSAAVLDKTLVGSGKWEIVEGTTQAISGHSYFIDTSVAVAKLSTPPNPKDDDFIDWADAKETFGTHAAALGYVDQPINGVAADYPLDTNNQNGTLVFKAALGWRFV